MRFVSDCIDAKQAGVWDRTLNGMLGGRLHYAPHGDQPLGRMAFLELFSSCLASKTLYPKAIKTVSYLMVDPREAHHAFSTSVDRH